MVSKNSDLLRITEFFPSVQGESAFTGLPTTFVRLAGCNLRCVWCDTEYSFGRGNSMSFDEILTQVRENGCPYVCVTGGEPLLQNGVHQLMKQLCDEGYSVSIETGGSLDITPVDERVYVILDIKCPGSGMSQKNLWDNMDQLRPHYSLKFVMRNEQDYTYAKEICEKYHLFSRPNEPLFSPVHGVLDPKDLVAWILKDKISVRLNLQVHKFIWHPDTKGV